MSMRAKDGIGFFALRLPMTSGCTTRWPAAALLIRRGFLLLLCLSPNVSCTSSESTNLIRLLEERLLDLRDDKLASERSEANGIWSRPFGRNMVAFGVINGV